MKIKKNKIINLSKKGKITKFFYGSDKFLKKIKEIYFSEVPPNEFKGWKYHDKRNQIMTVVKGTIQFKYKKKKKGNPNTNKVRL